MLSKLNKIRAFVVLTLVCILLGAYVGYGAIDLRVGYYSGGYHNTMVTYITTSVGGVYAATAAGFQDAIYSLNGTGGEIKVPLCDFEATQIKLISNIKIIGTGKASKITQGNSSDCDFFYMTGVRNVTIDGLYLYGNELGQTPAPSTDGYHHLIAIGYDVNPLSSACYGITVRNCWLENGTGALVFIATYCHNNTIENNHIVGRRHQLWGSGITIRGYNNFIINNFIADTFTGGIYCEGATGYPSAYNNIISENIVTGCIGVGIGTETGTDATILKDKATNNTISYNIVYKLNSSAFSLPIYGGFWSIGIGLGGNNNSCFGNDISYVEAAGIDLYNASDNYIERNTIKYIGDIANGYDGVGINIWGFLAYKKNGNAILGNNIFYCKNGIKMLYTNGNTISDNNIKYITLASGCGILCYKNDSVHHNTIRNVVGASSTCIYSIIGYNDISENRLFEMNGDQAIYGTTGDSIQGNTIISSIYTNKPIYGIITYGKTSIHDNTLIASGVGKFDTCIFAATGNSSIDGNRVTKSATSIRANGWYNSIKNNNDFDSTYEDIVVSKNQFTIVSNNNIRNAYRGIRIDTSQNCTITNNIVNATSGEASTPGIYEQTAPCDNNLFSGNNVMGCKVKKIPIIGANSIVTNNIGYWSVKLPATIPSAPVAGSVYVNTTTGLIGVYSGSAWLWH